MSLVTVGNAGEKGRGLFASRDIEQGAIIMVLGPPIMIALEAEALPTTCYGCLKQSDQLKSCTGCNVARFCDKTCQLKAHKAFHKYECPKFRIYKTTYESDPGEMLRAVLRLVLSHEAGRVPKDAFSELLSLHFDPGMQQRFMQEPKCTQDVQFLKTITQTNIDENLLWRLVGIFRINSFGIRAQNGSTIGSELWTTLSMANHSCRPNASFVPLKDVVWDRTGPHTMVSGVKLPYRSVCAAKHIRAGEEVTMTYLNEADMTMPLDKRRVELRQWGFTCQCDRCKEEEADRLSALPEFEQTQESVMNSLNRVLGREREGITREELMKEMAPEMISTGKVLSAIGGGDPLIKGCLDWLETYKKNN